MTAEETKEGAPRPRRRRLPSPKPPTPESLRQSAETLENISTALEGAAIALAAVALKFPLVAKELGAAMLALEAVALAFEQLAKDRKESARRLEERLRKELPDSPLPGTSTDPSGKGPPFDPAAFTPTGGRSPGLFLDDVAVRFERASQAGWIYADSLGQIEQASHAVADVLVLDNQRLITVGETLGRVSDKVGGFGDALTDLEGVGADVFRRLEGALGDFIRTGKAEWRDLAVVAIEAIGAILEAEIEALNAASSASGGGFLGDILGFFGGIFGGGGGGGVTTAIAAPAGFRNASAGLIAQHGATVATGVPVLVGEAGPEIFVPPSPGEIVPNDRLGGFGGGEIVNHFHYNIDARGADVGVEQRIRRMLQESEKRTVNRAKYEIFNDARRGGVFSRLSHR